MFGPNPESTQHMWQNILVEYIITVLLLSIYFSLDCKRLFLHVVVLKHEPGPGPGPDSGLGPRHQENPKKLEPSFTMDNFVSKILDGFKKACFG